MDPVTASILIGSMVMSKHQADQQKSAMMSAQRAQEKRMVENQNQLVEEGFKKSRQARGLGQPVGGLASQSGAALTSVTNGNETSLI